MLFLHGNGERGDGKGDLDYVLTHGPLFEAWCQKRDLPFVIISPQLPMFGQARFHTSSPANQIPFRGALPTESMSAPTPRKLRLPEPMQGKASDDRLPDGPQGPVDGWFEIEDELIAMVDGTVASFKGDSGASISPDFRMAASAPGTWPRAMRRSSRPSHPSSPMVTRTRPRQSPPPNYRCGFSPVAATR